jgi:phosphatidate phosphatase APP1
MAFKVDGKSVCRRRSYDRRAASGTFAGGGGTRDFGSTAVVREELNRAISRARELLGRPVRTARGRGGFVLQPYRGYGSCDEVFVIGRAFSQPTFGTHRQDGGARRQLIDIARRLLRRGIADAQLVARFCGAEQRVTADQDGYFRIHIRPEQPPPTDRLWHRMGLELIEPAKVEAEAELFVPPSTCRYVVISDIDDTIMDTGVASKVTMLWRLFMQGARSRVAFPGVVTFLQALHRGRSGMESNPMLYVSRGPWSIYEVLDEFFRLHEIPVGPILFLREWGLTLQRPLPRRAAGHKLKLIGNMLALYRELPFILIGDSGQRDPEIYTRVVHEHPGRVLAIYIRNVTRDPARRRAIEALAVKVVDAGSSLVLAADSLAMAEHAAKHGLISPSACSAILREREVQQGQLDLKPTLGIGGHGAQETRQAVARGDLGEALEGRSEEEGSPPNVVVEPKEGQGTARSGKMP